MYYLISRETFPGYFYKDANDVSREHAQLDLEIFIKIAKRLQITERFAGEEPFSEVTELYNQTMNEFLPKAGIRCTIIPRKKIGELVISASSVREYLRERKYEKVKEFVPVSSYKYLCGMSDVCR